MTLARAPGAGECGGEPACEAQSGSGLGRAGEVPRLLGPGGGQRCHLGGPACASLLLCPPQGAHLVRCHPGRLFTAPAAQPILGSAGEPGPPPARCARGRALQTSERLTATGRGPAEPAGPPVPSTPGVSNRVRGHAGWLKPRLGVTLPLRCPGASSGQQGSAQQWPPPQTTSTQAGPPPHSWRMMQFGSLRGAVIL